MKNSEDRKKLNEKLKEICNIPSYEKDFILGVNALLKNNDDIKVMLDYLNNNTNIPLGDITLKALEIYHKKDLK